MSKKDKQINSLINSKKHLISIFFSIIFVLIPTIGFIPIVDKFLGLSIRWATPAIGVISILAGLEVMAWSKFDSFHWKPIFSKWQNIIIFISLLSIYLLVSKLMQASTDFAWIGLISLVVISTIYLTGTSLFAKYLFANFYSE